jgi:hypothetical protein
MNEAGMFAVFSTDHLYEYPEALMVDAIADANGFGEWLKANPEPDLQQLIDRCGGYSRITAEAWAEYDRAVEDWQRRYRLRNNTAPAPPRSGS